MSVDALCLLRSIQVLCKSGLCEACHVCLTYLMLQWQYSQFNCRMLDRLPDIKVMFLPPVSRPICYDHVSLSKIEGPGPLMCIPQEQGGPVIPSALVSLFVASQVNGGSVRTAPTSVWSNIQSQSHVTTDDQSVCLGVKFTLEPVTRYYILSERCCVVSVWCPLWREVGSVSCQSLPSVFSPLSKIQYNLHCARYMF
jgi:hypothetical protein